MTEGVIVDVQFSKGPDWPFIHWTPDGAHLVFRTNHAIWTLNVEDNGLREIADVSVEDQRLTPPRGYFPPRGFYADVSPDGSRIIYSTCEFFPGYEIAMVNIDGTQRTRLTRTVRFEGYPAWSPDGRHIALAATRTTQRGLSSEAFYFEGFGTGLDSQLAIIDTAAGEVRVLDLTPARPTSRYTHLFSTSPEPVEITSGMRWLESTTKVALDPPVWSPNGRHLAFIVNEGEYPFDRIFYTIKRDGSEQTRIGETTAAPTWSPGGGELAFAAVEREQAVIHAVRLDGTGLRTIWRSGPTDSPSTVSQVSWSPDGSQLLFVSDGVYVIESNGQALLRIAHGSTNTRAVWSPDGARVAIYTGSDPSILLYMVDRDGSNGRRLVEQAGDGSLRASKGRAMR